MDLLNPITNMRTYTLWDRLKIDPMISYLDVRAKVYQEHLDKGLPEPTQEEILAACDKYGVNLETLQSKRNAVGPQVKTNSSQRMDMFQSQLSASVPPLGADFPYLDSNMRHDLWARSSCIKRGSGYIRVVAAIKYQFKTIFVYDYNGTYDYMMTDGICEANGYGYVEHTDLRDLEIGKEYDISQDSFLFKYPDQYNPTTDTVAMGVNVRTIISTNCDNSGDPAAVSESLAKKMRILKTKTVNIQLNNKSIKSHYPGKFPQLGEFIENTILFKVCNDIGVVSELSQSPEMSTGVEDDSILVEKNSYLKSIEVYCNNPIKDPDLEKYRLELLDFRHKVYDIVAPLVNDFPDKCSPRLHVLKGNYEHDLFNINSQELKFPYIRLTICTIDTPGEGAKLSTSTGAKVTIQRIYPDGYFKDELGRNIELIYPSTAIINRTVAGIPWEIYLTSFADLLKYRVDNDQITPQRCYEFWKKFMSIINLDREFAYADLTPEQLYEYFKTDFPRIIMYPYSNNIKLDIAGSLEKLAKEYIGYRKFDITVGMKERIKCTSQHTVGTFYMIRDYHDPQYGNSSSSVVERNTKGFATDKDSSKRDGRSLFGKKNVKNDVQNSHIQLNMVTNADADIMLNGTSQESMYGIVETMAGVGIGLEFQKTPEVEEED